MRTQAFGYIPGLTPVHRADPISKIILVLLVTSLAFLLPTALAVAQLALLAALCFLGRPPGAPTIRPLAVLCAFAALLMIFQILNSPGGAVVGHIGPVAVHQAGIDRGIAYAVRIATLMITSFLYVRTTDPRRLAVGLVHLGVPYRYAWMIFVSLTSVSLFRSQAQVAREAQLVRGLPPAQSFMHQRLTLWRRCAQSMLAIGLRRVEVVSVAMDLRGFGASRTRTFTDPFEWSAAGVVLAAVWAAALVATCAWMAAR
jgi:energy-coupling factor transport system permease protein